MNWSYAVPAPERQDLRDEVFVRMEEEGLLAAAMSAHATPDLPLWRELTHPDKAWLLRCDALLPPTAATSDSLLAAALLTPWRHGLWEFDFMVRRAHFALGPALARAALSWIWQHAPCDGLFGITPVQFRHVRQWAEAGGFTTVGRLPGACYLARRGTVVDGVLITASRGKPGQTGGKPGPAESSAFFTLCPHPITVLTARGAPATSFGAEIGIVPDPLNLTQIMLP